MHNFIKAKNTMYKTIYTKTQSQIKVRKKQHFLIFSK